MKRLIAVILMAIVAVGLVGCTQSVIDDVTISNVEKESYRPEGYDGPTDASGGLNWAGVIISGDVTNNSNETLDVVVVIYSYAGSPEKKMYERHNESGVVHLDPGETEKFYYDFKYDDNPIAGWYHGVSDVVKK